MIIFVKYEIRNKEKKWVEWEMLNEKLWVRNKEKYFCGGWMISILDS